MKHLAMLFLMLSLALPAMGVPLFSGADSADHDILSVRPYRVQGTSQSVMLIRSRALESHDYVVLLRSMAAESPKQLIAEVHFKDGQEGGDPYAVWLDACFVKDGSICNEQPAQRKVLTLESVLHTIETIMQRQRT